MPILDRLKECPSRDTLEQLQLERLQAVANRMYRHVKFYREYFDRAGLSPEGIESLRDLARLPFTDRQVLVSNHPYGLFAVPLRDIVRLHVASTGPAGDIVAGYTRNDTRHWNEMTGRALCAAGVTDDDVVQIAVSHDLYSGTQCLHHAAETLGATVMSGSGLLVEEQFVLLKQYRVSALVATPSNALNLLEFVRERGLQPNELFLRTVLLVGESIGQEAKDALSQELFARVYESYGVSEIATPGVAYECGPGRGLHLSEDLFIAEVVDPSSGEVLDEGEEGELVLTTLIKEGIPILRYRTGDRTRLLGDTCACGRTVRRMERVTSRTDDLVSVNGVRFFPRQVGDVLRELGYGDVPYRLEIRRAEHRDCLDLHVGVTLEVFGDEVKTIDSMKRSIDERLAAWLRIPTTVRMMEKRHLDEGPLVVDKRAL